MIWALINLQTEEAIAISETWQDTTAIDYFGNGVLYQWQQKETAPEILTPKWDNFAAEFYVPGGAFYESIRGKVAAANDFTISDEWQNIKHQITTIKNANTFCQAIAYLAQLLDNAGHPLSADDIDGLNTRLNNNDFPLSCQL